MIELDDRSLAFCSLAGRVAVTLFMNVSTSSGRSVLSSVTLLGALDRVSAVYNIFPGTYIVILCQPQAEAKNTRGQVVQMFSTKNGDERFMVGLLSETFNRVYSH